MTEKTEAPYEYMLKFWGGRKQQVIDSFDLEHEEGEMYQLKENRFGATIAAGLHNPDESVTLFFNTKEERNEAARHARNVGENALVTDTEEGTELRKCVIADVRTRSPRGEHRFMYNFGLGYPEDAAHFMFKDGNYSCDCNKSLFIQRVDASFPEHDCGEEIEIKQFDVHHVPLDELVAFREKYATLMTR